MIGQFIALYRARKDPILAKRLAGEILVDGVIGRISWPLTFAKFWMAVGIVGLFVILALLLTLGFASHWTFIIPALPIAAGIYGILKIWRGLNAGVNQVTKIAKQEVNNRTTGLSSLPNKAEENPNPDNTA